MISFIIPAFNEETHILELLESIERYAPRKNGIEIIVVDNGSTDDTVIIAEKHNVNVVVDPDATVAGLRNRGVKESSGDILIFLDADVVLTEQWQTAIPIVIRELEKRAYIVTGSRVGISKEPNFIERMWFQKNDVKEVNYINSGHLITTKTLFNALNGFDSSMESGEDYDFSSRARLIGAKIINNPDLNVIHEGYPKSIAEFIKREIWHGKGDNKSIRSILHSKIAILSITFLLLHFCFVVGILLSDISLVFVSLLLIVFECLFSSIIKFHKYGSFVVLIDTFIFYLYFLSRGISLLISVFSTKNNRSKSMHRNR